MSLKAGLVGCGNLGRLHAAALKQLGTMRMAAFCDTVPQAAERLALEFGGDYATSDVDRLLTDGSIAAIYVCTHHDSHAELCVRALAAGKHVMVEKPLALTVEECLQVGQAVEQSPAILMTAFKMRYYELVQKARELMPKPVLVTMQMMDDRWPDDIWANDPVRGGGNVLSQGCHSCDLLRFVANANPLEVYAAGGNYYQKTGVVDNLAAVFRFEGGHVGQWSQGDCSTPPVTSKFYMQLFAEGKSLTLSDRLCTLTYKEQGKPVQVITGSETGLLEENRAFLQAIEKGEAPPIDHIDGLYATLMVLQAFASARSGKAEPVAGLLSDLDRTANDSKAV